MLFLFLVDRRRDSVPIRGWKTDVLWHPRPLKGADNKMNSSMIGKIEKAHRYAREPERVRIHSLQATFHGGHDDHSVELRDGHWRCSCHAFSTHVLGTCAHVMAIQQMMSPMLSEEDRYSGDEFAATAEALPIAN